MNISQNNVSSNCNLKCSYSFKYSNSSCVAANTGQNISLTYDATNIPPVTYNGNKYKVSNVTITTSSNVLYNGKSSSGSIMIQHLPLNEGNSLIVIIPLTTGSSNTNATNILTTIITETANLAPQAGTKSTISIDNYNLNSIVPKKPFYSFTSRDDIIIYGIESAIPLDADTLTKLNTITKSNSLQYPNVPLFYNPNGPNSTSSSGNDDIYIDCQPVNVSEEEIKISNENKLSGAYSQKTQNDLGQTILRIIFSPWFQLLLLIFGVSLFFYFIRYLLKLSDTKDVK